MVDNALKALNMLLCISFFLSGYLMSGFDLGTYFTRNKKHLRPETCRLEQYSPRNEHPMYSVITIRTSPCFHGTCDIQDGWMISTLPGNDVT